MSLKSKAEQLNKDIPAVFYLWKNGKPKKWYYSLPIIFIWLLFLWLVIKIIFFRK